MMTKKQKLRNAVVLGLLMSSVVTGSAWAAKQYDGNNENYYLLTNETVEFDFAGHPNWVIGTEDYSDCSFGYGILVQNKKNVPSLQDNAILIAEKNLESLKIYVSNVKDTDNAGKSDGFVRDKVVGVLVGDAETIGVKYDGKEYGNSGYYAPVFTVKSEGDIDINVKTHGNGESMDNNDAVVANAYGILSNAGDVTLNSATGSVSINSFYDTEAANGNQKANIFGVYNWDGNTDITADESTITITATSAAVDPTSTAKISNNDGSETETEEISKATAVYADGGNVSLSSKANTLEANKISIKGKDFGTGHAIKAEKTTESNDYDSTTVELSATGDNILYGVVYAKGDRNQQSDSNGSESTTLDSTNDPVNAAGTVVTISSESGSNKIYSSAHGSSDEIGDRSHVVAAVYAQADGVVNITAGTNGANYIETHFDFVEGEDHKGDREQTVWAQNGGKINIDGRTEIISSNSGTYTDGHKGNAQGIAITAGTGVIIDKTGNVMDEFKDQETGALAHIEDADRSTVNLDYKNSSNGLLRSFIKGDLVSGYGGLIQVNSVDGGGLDMMGNALAANGGKLALDLGDGGTWYGRADDYGDAGLDSSGNHTTFYNPAFSNTILESGKVDITMNAGSKWVLTGQSWVTSLTANDSVIDIAGKSISEANKEQYNMNATNALVIGTFKGTGSTFIMDLDAAKQGTSDMLYIKDNHGTFNIELINAIDEAALSKIGELRFATIAGDVTHLPGTVSVGDSTTVTYSGSLFSDVTYDVTQEKYTSDDTDNGIYNNGTATPGSVKTADESDASSFENGKPGQEYVDANFKDGDINLLIKGVAARETGGVGQTIVDMSKINYSNAIYMDRLNKRMGEARFIDGDEGMWVRMRHDRIGKEDAFRSQNTMYEIGYDAKQIEESGEHRVGFAIDYMDGSAEYSHIGGSGEISRKGLWLYDTWMGENGHYRDFVAKWGHLSNDFDIVAPEGTQVTGDYSNNVYSISAEYGKKNDIGNNWYFEPQAQLQYAHVTDAEYMTNVGTRVSVDSINSLIARAGFRLGKDLGARSTVYFKADLLHEFLGEQDVFAMDNSTGVNGVHEKYDHAGTWCDVGFGFATAMSKTSYAYLDLETSLGNDYEETYQINAGMQWSF